MNYVKKYCSVLGSLFLLLPIVASAAPFTFENLFAQLLGIKQPTQDNFCYSFTRNLKFGDGGGNATEKEDDVRNLHNALTKEGFQINDGERKGGAVFGESTASAVTGFQEKYRSDILKNFRYGTGYVSDLTRAKLNQLYGCKPSISSAAPQPVQVGSSLTVYFTNGGDAGSVLLKTLDGSKTWFVPYETNATHNGFTKYDGAKVTFIVPSTIGRGQLPEGTGYEEKIPITSGRYNLFIYKVVEKEGVVADEINSVSKAFPITINVQPTITIVSPNGGEVWESSPRVTDTISGLEKYRKDVSWSGVEDYRDQSIVQAYLEKNVNGQYVVEGRIVALGYGSIQWVVGVVSKANCDLIFPSNLPNSCYNTANMHVAAPGQYYIRLVDTTTNSVSRSIAPFTITAPLLGPQIISTGGIDQACAGGECLAAYAFDENKCTIYSGVRQGRVFPSIGKYYPEPIDIAEVEVYRSGNGGPCGASGFGTNPFIAQLQYSDDGINWSSIDIPIVNIPYNANAWKNFILPKKTGAHRGWRLEGTGKLNYLQVNQVGFIPRVKLPATAIIQSVRPSPITQGDLLYITGLNFDKSASIIVDEIGKTSPEGFDDETLRTLRFVVDKNITPGIHTVQIQNADTPKSNAFPFTVVAPTPTPTITSIVPDRGSANDTITIYGSNLSKISELIFYRANGLEDAAISATTFLSMTDDKIVFKIAPEFVAQYGDSGFSQIRVATPEKKSNAMNFTLVRANNSPMRFFDNAGEVSALTLGTHHAITARFDNIPINAAKGKYIVNLASNDSGKWRYWQMNSGDIQIVNREIRIDPLRWSGSDKNTTILEGMPAGKYTISVSLSGSFGNKTISRMVQVNANARLASLSIVSQTLPTTSLNNGSGVLARFKMSASDGDVSVESLKMKVQFDGFTSISVKDVNLYVYTNNDRSIPAVIGNNNDGAWLSQNIAEISNGAEVIVVPSNGAFKILVDAPRYFELRGKIAGVVAGSAVQTELLTSGIKLSPPAMLQEYTPINLQVGFLSR